MGSQSVQTAHQTLVQVTPAAAESSGSGSEVLVAVIGAVASIMAAFAWPAVVLILAIMFKSALSTLIGRIKSIKHGDTELGLDKEFQDRLVEAPEVPENEENPAAEQVMENTPRAPIDAIVTAWVEVERAVERAFNRLSRSATSTIHRPYTVTRALRILANEELIVHSTLAQIDELRQLRNLVVHRPEESLSPDSVELYVANAAQAVRELDRAGRNAAAPPN